MSITSFDHFIETLDHVPAELHRNFNLMADLDKRISEMIRRINDCVQEYRRAERKDDRASLSKESMDLFDKARCFSDEKIDLATATYDLVDKHIRRLEGLKGAQAVFGGDVNSNSSANHRNNVSFSNTGAGGASTGTGGSNSKNVKKEKKDGDGLSFATKEPALAVDMPLDPNEPKYCTCHQVSFGEMIACDNKDCPVEWFHFACVDLKAKPKGKWYCPECFNINKKGKHKVKKLKIC